MLLITLSLLVTFLVLLLFGTLKNGITPTSTSRRVRNCIWAHLPEFDGRAADLGSGFGDFARAFSKELRGKPLYCYEAALLPFYLSKLFFIVTRARIELRRQNFLKEDLGEYDLVFCYLYRKVMSPLWAKLQKELKAGSWVITHTFAFEGVQPKKVIYADDLYRTPIYFYQI